MPRRRLPSTSVGRNVAIARGTVTNCVLLARADFRHVRARGNDRLFRYLEQIVNVVLVVVVARLSTTTGGIALSAIKSDWSSA